MKSLHEFPLRAAIPALLAAAVIPSLINVDSFVLLDDIKMVERGIRESIGFFGGDYFLKNLKFFRPGLLVLCRLDGLIWGSRIAGYHLTNIILFACSCFLVWGLARKFLSPFQAWLAAVIFALHPIQVSSVVWLTGRTDLLPGIFIFAAAILYLDRGGPARRAMALVAFILALASKETAIMLPAALILGEWLKTGGVRKIGRRAMPFIVVAILYVAYRIYTGVPDGSSYYNPLYLITNKYAMTRNAFSFATNAVYLFIPLWNPIDIMGMDFPDASTMAELVFNRGTAPILIYLAAGWTALIFIVAAAYKKARGESKETTGKHGTLWFGVGWFLLFLAPVIHVLANMAGFRYLFIPTMGGVILLVWAAGLVLEGMADSTRKIIVISFVLLCLAMNVIEQMKWKRAFDTAEFITDKVIDYTQSMEEGETLIVYGLPQSADGGRLVYPGWDRYSLPMSVRLLGGKEGVRVKVAHAPGPQCNREGVRCIDIMKKWPPPPYY